MDTVTSEYKLSVNLGFADGDTRTINLKNPKTSLQASAINDVGSYLETNNVVIGDKTGAASAGILTADRIRETKNKLDLS